LVSNLSRQVLLPSPIIDVACGSLHTMALTESSEVYVWGRNNSGQLGLGDTRDRDTPEKLNFPGNPPVSPFRLLSSIHGPHCDRLVMFGGSHARAATGQGLMSGIQTTLKLILTRLDISKITCGACHVLVLLTDNSLGR
jgi:hypothetical protein